MQDDSRYRAKLSRFASGAARNLAVHITPPRAIGLGRKTEDDPIPNRCGRKNVVDNA
jgi:hypothetical protein